MNFCDPDGLRKASRPAWKHLAPGAFRTLLVPCKVNAPRAISLDCCLNADSDPETAPYRSQRTFPKGLECPASATFYLAGARLASIYQSIGASLDHLKSGFARWHDVNSASMDGGYS